MSQSRKDKKDKKKRKAKRSNVTTTTTTTTTTEQFSFEDLRQAILDNDIDGVKHILDVAGAGILNENRDGFTALHIAAERPKTHRKIISLLLNAKPELLDTPTPSAGSTPLHLAAANKNKTMALILIEKGAKVNAKTNNGDTPLLYAVNRGEVEVVKALLKKDPTIVYDLDASGAKIHSKASERLFSKIKNPDLEIMTAFYDAYETLGLILPSWVYLKMRKFNSALLSFESLEQAFVEIRDVLVLDYKNINIADKNGMTLLHVAAIQGNYPLIKSLLDFGVLTSDDLKIANHLGETALHLAVQEGRAEIVELLLTMDTSSLNKKTIEGKTVRDLANDLAKENGQKEVLALLRKQRGVGVYDRVKLEASHTSTHSKHSKRSGQSSSKHEDYLNYGEPSLYSSLYSSDAITQKEEPEAEPEATHSSLKESSEEEYYGDPRSKKPWEEEQAPKSTASTTATSTSHATATLFNAPSVTQKVSRKSPHKESSVEGKETKKKPKKEEKKHPSEDTEKSESSEKKSRRFG